MKKHAYTINEVCHQIGIGRTKLYQEIAEGRLVARKANKRTIVLHDDLMKYLAQLPSLPAKS